MNDMKYTAYGMSAGLNKYLQCILLCVYGWVYDHLSPSSSSQPFSSPPSSLKDVPVLQVVGPVHLDLLLCRTKPFAILCVCVYCTHVVVLSLTQMYCAYQFPLSLHTQAVDVSACVLVSRKPGESDKKINDRGVNGRMREAGQSVCLWPEEFISPQTFLFNVFFLFSSINRK